MSTINEMTADLVSAYVANNKVPADELAALIGAVHGALVGADAPAAEPAAETVKLTAAQIRKSVTDSGIVSFEDGKTYKSMKRSLTVRGLTPDTYRQKWGLPKDYPMVSPAYAAARSAMAKAIGLGSKGRNANPAVALKAVAKTKAAAARPPTAIDPATDDFA